MKSNFALIVCIVISINSIAQQVDVSLLNPTIKSATYEFLRFGVSNSYYGGLMYNISSESYGDGDDFTLFTYSDRDIVLSPGAGNVIMTRGSNNKVGIGTYSPEKKLHVKGDMKIERGSGGYNFLEFSSNASGSFITSNDPGTNHKHLYFQVVPTNQNATDRHMYFKAGSVNGELQTRLFIQGNGRIGLGTVNPGASLSVRGHGNNSSYQHFLIEDEWGNDDLIVDGSGRMKLGHNIPFPSDQDIKLAVDGKSIFEEVIVKLSDEWPDYVFEDNYPLMPLTELKTFLERNKHLPDIPSAEEIEENGQALGELNKLLLKKVEELTLYIIQLEEKNKNLEHKDQKYEALIDELTKRIENLERNSYD